MTNVSVEANAVLAKLQQQVADLSLQLAIATARAEQAEAQLATARPEQAEAPQ